MPIFDVLKKKSGRKKAASSTPIKKKSLTKNKTTNKKSPKVADRKKEVARIESGAYRVLVKPLISEKATLLGSENKYVFAVTSEATKKEVAQAVRDVYGVRPIKVNIISVLGKNRRYGRVTGRTKDRKKAVVTLMAGESIKLYEGV